MRNNDYQIIFTIILIEANANSIIRCAGLL